RVLSIHNLLSDRRGREIAEKSPYGKAGDIEATGKDPMLRPEDLPKPSTRRCAAMAGFELLMLTAIVVAVAPTVCSQTVNSVLTYRFNSHGDGENTSETTLTPSNVNASQFKKLFS